MDAVVRKLGVDQSLHHRWCRLCNVYADTMPGPIWGVFGLNDLYCGRAPRQDGEAGRGNALCRRDASVNAPIASARAEVVDWLAGARGVIVQDGRETGSR